MIDIKLAKQFIDTYWITEILPSLSDFIRIPNLSKMFDDKWNENGLLDKAAQHIFNWAKSQKLKGFQGEILKDNDKSPLVFLEIEGSNKDSQTVLFYGHFDKQPHLQGWAEGLGPTIPVVKDNKLYGRGGADDGYAIYAIIACIKLCQEQNIQHPRCVITIEGNEESGSQEYPIYLNLLKSRIGQVSLVIGVDTGGLTYDSFWITNSLRGCIAALLKVKVLKEGVHSGEASGIVPSSFRIIRQLLDRIENSKTGQLNSCFYDVIPPCRYQEQISIAKQLNKVIINKYPFENTMQPIVTDPQIAIFNNTWKPTLCVTGADGLPQTAVAGNVLRSETILKLSLRLPPTLNVEQAGLNLKQILEKDPPYGADVSCTILATMNGWNAKEMKPKLQETIQVASKNFFENESFSLGSGGTIPLMNLLQNQFPQAQFIICGSSGPCTSAHSVNENLDILCTKKLIGCLAQIINEIETNK